MRKKEGRMSANSHGPQESPINNHDGVTASSTMVARIRAACPTMPRIVPEPPAPVRKLSPQEQKQEKIIKHVAAITGTTFHHSLAAAVEDALRTGLKQTDKEREEEKEFRLHCNAEYHFARFTGEGATLAPLLYGISFHLAGTSKNFFISMQEIARFLEVKEDALYSAAHLLVASGFWEVLEQRKGNSSRYRPIGHEEWAARNRGRYCTVKCEHPHRDDTPQHELGRKLFAITGEKFWDSAVERWRKLGTDEQLEQWAREFMADENGNGEDAAFPLDLPPGKLGGIFRRKRLGDHFQKMAAEAAND